MARVRAAIEERRAAPRDDLLSAIANGVVSVNWNDDKGRWQRRIFSKQGKSGWQT